MNTFLRLTTDNPQTNFETAMNYVFSKDGEAFIRHDGISENVPLWQYLDRLCAEKGCMLDESRCSESTDERCCDCAMDSSDCPMALMYIFASQAVNLRGRLKQYEDTGYSHEEIQGMIKRISNKN
jgi:hypothetical protein